jgi:hypothetical protein
VFAKNKNKLEYRMKSLIAMSFGLSLFALSSATQALDANSLYISAMLGNGNIDVDGKYTTVTDDPSKNGTTIASYSVDDAEAAAYTFTIGYNIYDWLGVEGQVAVFEEDKSLGNYLEITGTTAAGLYAVLGAGGDAYAQFLIGVGSSAADYTGVKTETDYSPSSTSYSYGARIGSKVGPGSFEIMYMRYPDIRFDKNDFYDATSVGNVDSGNDNLGGIRLSRHQAVQVLSVGYRYTFNF